ncbi:hypothetical protein HRbin23_00677 [bacterium HR23]|nr:hypothetical protein HRbin23_00677 [bacterium HR23]
MRIVLLGMGAGFLVNLTLGLLAFRSGSAAIAFALLGLLLGGAFGVAEVWLRRRQQRGRG